VFLPLLFTYKFVFFLLIQLNLNPKHDLHSPHFFFHSDFPGVFWLLKMFIRVGVVVVLLSRAKRLSPVPDFFPRLRLQCAGWQHTLCFVLDLLIPCHSQWSIGCRQLSLVLLPPSSSSWTWTRNMISSPHFFFHIYFPGVLVAYFQYALFS